MKKVTITIDTTNDAFENLPEAEVGRILGELAYQISEDLCGMDSLGHKIRPIALFDSNGNKVGQCVFK